MVEGMIPMLTTTAISGDGGLGKSLLAMQIMTCCTLGKPFLGRDTKQSPAIGLFCEDYENQLHERQDKINTHYNISFNDLPDLNYIPRVGAENSLMTIGDFGKLVITPFYHQFRQTVIDMQAKLVIIDTAADTFTGNENIRTQVRAYIQLLNGIANDIQGAVVLLVHPSISGLQSGTGTSGSTAWNNGVRSRWYLEKPQEDTQYNTTNSNIRIFSQKKSNYSAVDPLGIELEWKNGVFERTPGENSTIRKMELNQLSLKCLDVIKDCVEKNIYFSLSEKSQNYAPRKLAEKFKRQYKAYDIKTVIEQMIDCGKLLNTPFKNNGREFFRIEPNKAHNNTPTAYSEPIDNEEYTFDTHSSVNDLF